MYLAGQITLYAAEVNVVRKARLWPRSLGAEAKTDADKRSLDRHAQVEERVPVEDVRTHFNREEPTQKAG
jgi:hypothetical protein